MTPHPVAAAMPVLPQASLGQAFEHVIGARRIEQFIFGDEFVERSGLGEIEQFKRTPFAAKRLDRADQRTRRLEPTADLGRIYVQMIGDQSMQSFDSLHTFW